MQCSHSVLAVFVASWSPHNFRPFSFKLHQSLSVISNTFVYPLCMKLQHNSFNHKLQYSTVATKLGVNLSYLSNVHMSDGDVNKAVLVANAVVLTVHLEEDVKIVCEKVRRVRRKKVRVQINLH